MSNPNKSKFNDYVAGAVGGCAGLVVGHPLDTTKVQLQTQGNTAYKGTLDAMKGISKHGMARGFYRGLGFPFTTYAVINSVFFGVYGHSISRLTNGNNSKPTYAQIVAAGAMGGFAQLAIACPVDVVKVVLQSQIPAGKQQGIGAQSGYFSSTSDCIATVYRKQGLPGLYRGSLIMALRDIPALSLYITSYELMYGTAKKRFNPDKKMDCVYSLAAGGTAGVLSWVTTMPMDTIKSKIQSQAATQGRISITECVRDTIRTSGFRGLYRGMGIASIRAFPVNGVTFMVYSQTLHYLDNRSAILFEEAI